MMSISTLIGSGEVKVSRLRRLWVPTLVALLTATQVMAGDNADLVQTQTKSKGSAMNSRSGDS
jgi:hypothetical protein